MPHFTSPSTFVRRVAAASRSFLVAGALSLLLIGALTLGGVLRFRSQAATEVPGFSTFLRLNSTSAPAVQSLNNLQAGDTVHVYLTVTNTNTSNTISDLQYYSAFAHEGVLSWIEPDGLGMHLSSNSLTYQVPNSLSLRYKAGSTKTATNRNGTWEYANSSDNSANESKTFSDSNDPNTGFHWSNVTGGNNGSEAFQYTVKYELEVVANNTAVFNNHSQDVPTFQVRKRGESTWQNSVSNLSNGDIVEFQVHVHNTQRGSKALNTRVGVSNWSSTAASSLALSGFVDADNANPASSTVNLTNTTPFRLEYIDNSTRFQGRPSVSVPAYDPNQVRPDGITSATGIQIGDVGELEACWDFQVIALFQARVVTEVIATPTPTPSPTPTPTLACNAACTSSAQCSGGMTCSNGFCRNLLCTESTSCTCSTPTPTPSPSPTPTPTPTPSVTPSPSPSPSPSPTPSVTPTPSPTPTPTPLLQCNASCTSNSQCANGLFCSNGSCRRPECSDKSDCSCGNQEYTGFAIEKYEDQDGDGSRDAGEPGLTWEFEWKKKGEDSWRSYFTYANHDGRGGTVGGRSTGEEIIIREKSQGGWRATTSEEVTITLAYNEIKIAKFGNQRLQPTKPATTSVPTPSQLPKTGSQGEVGLVLSFSLAMTGGALSWLRSRIKQP